MFLSLSPFFSKKKSQSTKPLFLQKYVSPLCSLPPLGAPHPPPTGSHSTTILVPHFLVPHYLDCLQTGPFQHHNEPTASHLASRPESGPLGRHHIPVLFLVPTVATLTRLESTTGRSHLASRPEIVLLSFNQTLTLFLIATFLPATILKVGAWKWRGLLSGAAAISPGGQGFKERRDFPMRNSCAPSSASVGPGRAQEAGTSGALSPASTWATDPRVKGAVSKVEWGRGGPAPPPDLWCRRSQDRTWPRT